MALAVAALSEQQVGRIILTRPAVEAGERLGFLPGDMLAKVDPYLRPLFDALYDMLDADRLTAYMERGTIEVAPLAFMRGRTLNDSFIILDEAQNTSPEQMQMFLTRLGFGSKVVVTGDVTQIDLPREQASGPDPGAGHPRRRSTGSRSSSSRTRTSCGTSSCSGSSRRTSATPRRPARSAQPLMVAVEVANRSGAEVDEAAPRRSRARVLAAEGDRGGRARARVRRAGRDARAEARAPRASTRRRTCSRSRSTGATRCRAGCRARSATSSSARRSSATGWRAPLVHGLLHLLGYDHGAEMEAREARAPRMSSRTAALAPRELQLRVRRDHPRAPHAAEHADPLRRRGASCSSPPSPPASTSSS